MKYADEDCLCGPSQINILAVVRRNCLASTSSNYIKKYKKTLNPTATPVLLSTIQNSDLKTFVLKLLKLREKVKC